MYKWLLERRAKSLNSQNNSNRSLIYKQNKKFSVFSYILLTCSIVNFLLGLLNSYYTQKGFYDFFSFTQQSNLFILLVMIFFFTSFKNTKIYNLFIFISVVNVLFNTLILRNILYESSRIFFYNDGLLKRYIGLTSNFLAYIFMPLVFFFFCLKYNNFSTEFFNYHKLYFVNMTKKTIMSLIYFLFYFLIDFILLKIFFDSSWIVVRTYSIYHNNTEYYLILLIKTILSFILINYIIIYFFQIKIKKIRHFLFLVVCLFFICSMITATKSNFLHAKKFFSNEKMGSLLWPESLDIAEELSDNVTDKNKLELTNNQWKIIELGAGTGNITSFLVEKYGIDNIIAIEFDAEMCTSLRNKFPNLKVINGDVTNLINLLTKNEVNLTKIIGIISTLPLSIFSEKDFNILEKDLQIIMQEKSVSQDVKFKEYRFSIFLKKTKMHNILETYSKTNIKCCFNNWICPTLIYSFEKN
ncbi:MAG: rRNA adenine N-6-methyltransferase family protein [Vigna little leaf phytoplasma]|nr:rRNA adenine N-6-methyltransferase family protein [Vigna little leaf phytoplasma]